MVKGTRNPPPLSFGGYTDTGEFDPTLAIYAYRALHSPGDLYQAGNGERTIIIEINDYRTCVENDEKSPRSRESKNTSGEEW